MQKRVSWYAAFFIMMLVLTGEGCPFRISQNVNPLPPLTGQYETDLIDDGAEDSSVDKLRRQQEEAKKEVMRQSVANFETFQTEDEYNKSKPMNIDSVANFDTMSGTAPDGEKDTTQETTSQPVAQPTSQQEPAPVPTTGARSTSYDGKMYYAVPAGKTGNEICAAAGKTCVGYTAKTVDVCMHFNPGAMPTFTNDGSNSAFYCNGAPQGGICAKLSNACNICQACGVNMDCQKKIGDLEREAYVQCS